MGRRTEHNNNNNNRYDNTFLLIFAMSKTCGTNVERINKLKEIYPGINVVTFSECLDSDVDCNFKTCRHIPKVRERVTEIRSDYSNNEHIRITILCTLGVSHVAWEYHMLHCHICYISYKHKSCLSYTR